MIKTILISFACSAAAVSATYLYVGRTTYSSAFQVNFPLNSAIKVAPDAGNIWSWHHQVSSPSFPTTFDVLVDIDGDQVMDTVHPEVRVLITDVQLVAPVNANGYAWINDSLGKRLAVGVGGVQTSGPVQHVSLATPISLPVGSFLHVELSGNSGGDYAVNLIGRVVNL